MAKKLKFGKWTVNLDDGFLSYEDWYHIPPERLTENNWILHLSEKNWIDFNEFIPAYLTALRHSKIREVKIISYYG